MNIQDCIVCSSNLVESFQTSDSLNYWHCNSCGARFLDKKHHIDKDSEKKRYLEHENIIEDEGYRNFLSKLSSPLMDKINTNAKGLDFGCGHGPALADIFIKNKYSIDLYDPFFFPNKEIFLRTYDFITCTETAEHFFNPKTRLKYTLLRRYYHKYLFHNPSIHMSKSTVSEITQTISIDQLVTGMYVKSFSDNSSVNIKSEGYISVVNLRSKPCS